MAGEQTKPLTPQEAKQRLREVAHEASVAAWVKRSPLQAVTLGFIAGAFLASSPRTRALLAQVMSQQFIKSML